MNALVKLGAGTVGALVVAAGAFALALYGAFAGGYAAQQVWAWLLPLGLGLPTLGWKHFWAIGTVSRLCFGSRTEQKKTDEDKWTKLAQFALALAGPWIVLAFAWWLKP
jgi:hypothetical protein